MLGARGKDYSEISISRYPNVGIAGLAKTEDIVAKLGLLLSNANAAERR